MTYTLNPLPDPNLDHVGFYLIAVICTLFIVFWFITCCINESHNRFDGKTEYSLKWPHPATYALLAPLVTLIFFSFSISYRDEPVPRNEQIIGVRVGSGAAEETERVGKVNRLVTTPYISYQVPEGVVTFRMSTGVVWPDRVVLYRN